MSHHTKARTAEVNREDQSRDNSQSARRSATGLKSSGFSICGLSEVGVRPESRWHQLDVLTPIPPD